MIAPDIVSLRHFYDTPFGADVCRFIGDRVRELWPSAREDVILGVGYCMPYLEHLRAPGTVLSVCMPASQGAAYWPIEGENLVCLSHEAELPFRESSINRILLVHSMENTEYLSGLLDELRRLLVPGGRLLLVVPNRIGFWCHAAHTPFGYGRPFSVTQLRELLEAEQFALTYSSSCLFMPPVRIRPLWRMARHVESMLRVLCPVVGGVLIVEAQKQIYASIRQPVRSRTFVPAGTRAVLGIE